MAAMTFTQKVATACGLAVATFLLLVLLYYTFDVVMLVFAAALLAIFLSGLADIIKPYIPLGDGLRVLLVSGILLHRSRATGGRGQWCTRAALLARR